jgi:single-strand DNA-binding protein
MATYHEVEIAGNLGRDPEMSYTPEGTARTSFSLAAQTGRGDYKGTIWFRITFWGNQAEAINANVQKGDLVMVKGELEHDDDGHPQIWKGKDDGQPHANFNLRGRVCQFLHLKGGGQKTEDWEDWSGEKEEEIDIPF